MKTNEQFLQDFNKKGNQTLEILEKYKGCTTPILIKCKKCGSTFYQAPHELSQKYKLDRHQIVAFLKDGKELGLCPSYTIGKNRLGMRVEAYDANGHLLGSFPSLKICAEKLNEKYHLNCLPNSISHVLSGAQKSHRNLYFKEARMYE